MFKYRIKSKTCKIGIPLGEKLLGLPKDCWGDPPWSF